MDELFDISGKVALITGGTHGLGRMIAEGMVAAGVKTYVTSRRADQAEAAAREMATTRGKCIGLAADLSTAAGASALAKDILSREEKLHILVNNAGKTWGAPIDSFPDEGWERVMTVNVQSPFTLIRDLLPVLEAAGTAQDPARVINIGSAGGKRASPNRAYSYAASKAAIHHLSRQVACDLVDRYINVNTVVPGYFPTKMSAHLLTDGQAMKKLTDEIPMKRLGLPDEIAGICIYLSSQPAAYITGAEFAIDGGLVGCA